MRRDRGALALVFALVLAAACGGLPAAPPDPPAAGSSGAGAQAPPDPEVLRAVADAARGAGRLRTAEAGYLAVLAAAPGDAGALRALRALRADRPALALEAAALLAHRADARAEDRLPYLDLLLTLDRLADVLVEVPAPPPASLPTEGVPAEVARRAVALVRLGRADEALALTPFLGAGATGAAGRSAVARALAEAGAPDAAEAEWARLLAEMPDEPGPVLDYAAWHRERGRPARALALCRRAALRFPKNAAVEAGLAAALEAGGERVEALAAWTRAMTLAPDSPEYADAFAQALLAADRSEEAIGAWELAATRFPDAEGPIMHLALAHRARGAPADLARVLRPFAARRPEEPRAQLALGEALLASGSPEAGGVLARARALGASPEVVVPLQARAAADAGEAEAAARLFEEAVALNPGLPGLRMAAALHAVSRGDLLTAAAGLEAALARDPHDETARDLLGHILSGDPDRDVRLERTKTYPSLGGDAALAALGASVHAPAEGALATVLRDEREVRVEAGRISAIVLRRSVLLQHPRARERYGEISINTNVHHPAVVRVARVLLPDGGVRPLPPSAIEQRGPDPTAVLQTDGRDLVLHFEPLEPGAAIDYEVEIPLPHPDELGAWWDRYILANVDPTVEARYTLDTPVDELFSADAPGMGEPETLVTGDRRRTTYRRRDLPPTPLGEDGRGATGSPAEAEGVARVSVASVRDWAGVDAWYWRLFAPQAVVDPTVAEAARAATAGATSRRARVAAILTWVEGRTRYVADEMGIGAYRPRPAARTLETRAGDCKDVTALLAALLAAVDIPAYPALVRPDGPGVFGDAYPTPALFTHVLLFVPDPEGDFWLDATARQGTPEAVPALLRGRQALIVDGRGGRRARVPTGDPARNRVTERIELALTPTGGATTRRTVAATGDPAAEVRERLLPLSEADRAALLAAPGVFLDAAHTAGTVRVEGLTRPLEPVRLDGEVQYPDVALVRTDGALVVQLALEAIVEPVLAGRPLDELGARSFERSLRLVFPAADYTPNWRPIRLDRSTSAGEVHLRERRERGATTLDLKLRLEALPRETGPRADWLAGVESMRTAHDRELVLTPGPSFDRVAFFRTMSDERPNDRQLAVLLVGALADARRGEEAVAAAHAAADRLPDAPEFVTLWAMVLGGFPTLPVPFDALEIRAARFPRDARLHLALADLEAREGRTGPAEDAYRAVLAVEPGHGAALNNLAWLLRTDPARRAEATSLARRAVAARPRSDAAWDTLAELLFLDDDVVAALGANAEAVHLADTPAAKRLYAERRRRYEQALRQNTGGPTRRPRRATP